MSSAAKSKLELWGTCVKDKELFFSSSDSFNHPTIQTNKVIPQNESDFPSLQIKKQENVCNYCHLA